MLGISKGQVGDFGGIPVISAEEHSIGNDSNAYALGNVHIQKITHIRIALLDRDRAEIRLVVHIAGHLEYIFHNCLDRGSFHRENGRIQNDFGTFFKNA